MTNWRTWPEAHEGDPAHREPGGVFGCPVCLRAKYPLPIEATCASCGDTVFVPGDEDPEDTLCAPCAEDEQSGDDGGEE